VGMASWLAGRVLSDDGGASVAAWTVTGERH
jgi:hypothetical protein